MNIAKQVDVAARRVQNFAWQEKPARAATERSEAIAQTPAWFCVRKAMQAEGNWCGSIA